MPPLPSAPKLSSSAVPATPSEPLSTLPLTWPELTPVSSASTSWSKVPTRIGEPLPSRSTFCSLLSSMPLPTPTVVTLRPLLAMNCAQAVAVASARALPPVPVCSLGLPSLTNTTWLLHPACGT